jgi:hypothetical protein
LSEALLRRLGDHITLAIFHSSEPNTNIKHLLNPLNQTEKVGTISCKLYTSNGHLNELPVLVLRVGHRDGDPQQCGEAMDGKKGKAMRVEGSEPWGKAGH